MEKLIHAQLILLFFLAVSREIRSVAFSNNHVDPTPDLEEV